jgi:hypothetical protein
MVMNVTQIIVSTYHSVGFCLLMLNYKSINSASLRAITTCLILSHRKFVPIIYCSRIVSCSAGDRLTSTLISRFLLKLRKVSQAPNKGARNVSSYQSLYLTSDAPSTHSNSDFFFAELECLLTEPSMFSETLRSQDIQTAKDIELKLYQQRDTFEPSIFSEISSGNGITSSSSQKRTN